MRITVGRLGVIMAMLAACATPTPPAPVVAPPRPIPSPPTAPRLTAPPRVTPRAIVAGDLVWDAAVGAVTYRVERKVGSCADAGAFGVLAPSVPATTYRDTTAVAGTAYAYRVASNEAAGYSNCIERVTPSTGDTIPPPNPGTPTAGTPIPGPSTVTIPMTWAASIDQQSNTPVPTYVYSGGFNDNSGFVNGSSPTNRMDLVVAYHASGLAAGGWICIRAQDAAGNMSPDPVGACGPLTVPAKPIIEAAAPTETVLCPRRYDGKPPDTTGGWSMELFNGSLTISAKGTTTTRDVMLQKGAYSITAKWTKTGQMVTSAATTGVCQ